MNDLNVGALLHLFSQWEYVYVLLSLGIAILIWVESTLLERNERKFPKNSAFGMVSMATSSWLLISGLALWLLEFDRFAVSVPVMYAIYSVMGWVYGARLMRDTGMPDDPMDVVIPAKYLSFNKSFALSFAGLCLFVMVKAYLSSSV